MKRVSCGILGLRETSFRGDVPKPVLRTASNPMLAGNEIGDLVEHVLPVEHRARPLVGHPGVKTTDRGGGGVP